MTEKELINSNPSNKFGYSQWGRNAESIVAKHLPNSIRVKGFDILWCDRKIEVRSSFTKSSSSGWRFRTSPNHGADVIVCIVLDSNSLYYWVVPVNEVSASSINLTKGSKYAVKVDELGDRILQSELNNGKNKDRIIPASFSISDDVLLKLDKVSYTSGKSKSALVEEALTLLFKSPGGNK